MLRHERLEPVHLLVMEEDVQVLNADTVGALNAALDAVEASEGPAALVLTGEGKSFNQGLDLPWVMGLGEDMPAFLKTVHAVFGRLYRLDMPTVAAVNGHVIAGGAMLAQCFDERIMRSDRGWFRLPEVELQLPFTTVMDALLASRLPQPARHRLMVLGERMSGMQAADAGVVDAAVEGGDGPRAAGIAQAAELAQYRGPTIAQIRTKRYAELLATVDADAGRTNLFN